MNLEARQRHPASAMNAQILGEIRDFCRETRTAESTFGRRVVNDGKLVSRLRDGARITTETLEKVRSYLSVSRPPPSMRQGPSTAPALPRHRPASRNWMWPHRGSGSSTTGRSISCSSRLAARRPRSPIASRSNSPTSILLRRPSACSTPASAAACTVLSRVMRAMHARFPTMPLYVVAKEISYEDVRLTLEKMADRLFEHPATVLVLTNLYYAEAPWLTPRSASAAQSLIWKDVALSGNTSHGFAEQIANLEGFLAENWRAGIKTSGNPVYLRPIILTLRREDHTFLLDPILPRPGRVTADYDLVIASQPYRARASLEFKASKVVAPLVQSLRPGGRLIGVHSHGDDPGLEIIRDVWPGENPFTSDRHAILRQVKHELGSAAAPLQFQQRVVRRPSHFQISPAHAARRGQRPDRHVDAIRSLERRDLRLAGRGPAA